MWFVILWITLGMLFFGYATIRRRWITGQTAFTGVWFASLTALWFSPSTRNIISGDAALIIVLAHASFFLGSVGMSNLSSTRVLSSPKRFILTSGSWRASVCVFWIFVSLGIAGSVLMAFRVGTFTAVQEGTLALLRHHLSIQRIQLMFHERLMSNFSYPAALLGAVCFLFSRRSLRSWSYLVLPFMAILLYSLNFGGRGAITIGGLMILWSLLIGRTKLFGERIRSRTELLLLVGLGFFVLWYLGFIFETRLTSFDYFERSVIIRGSLYKYFTGPIPAFSEWLNLYQPLPFMNLDLSNLAVVREVMHLFGFQIERTIDRDIVFVPYPFNVFTHLSEQMRYFGIIGALVASHILGMISASMENKPLSVSVIGTRATIYTYLSFSFFADLSFLAVGWWFALITSALIVPLLDRAIFSNSPPKYARVGTGVGFS